MYKLFFITTFILVTFSSSQLFCSLLQSRDAKEIEFEGQKGGIFQFLLRARANGKQDRFSQVRVLQKLVGHGTDDLKFMFFNSTLLLDISKASIIESLNQNKFFFFACCQKGKDAAFNLHLPGVLIIDTNDETVARNGFTQFHVFLSNNGLQKLCTCEHAHVFQNGQFL